MPLKPRRAIKFPPKPATEPSEAIALPQGEEAITPETASPLEALRMQIDTLDQQLLDLMAQRQTVVRAIGDYKQKAGLPPLDEARWQRVLKTNLHRAETLGLCTDFTSDLYTLIHDYSLKLEAACLHPSENPVG